MAEDQITVQLPRTKALIIHGACLRQLYGLWTGGRAALLACVALAILRDAEIRPELNYGHLGVIVL
jgi:hypothetical protein